MPPRAAPLPPQARRDALVDATVPLLSRHGRKVSTRQIAGAAGVAEGTIFRVFATKDELVEAAVERALAPGLMAAELDELDPDLPLRERLVAVVGVLQRRFTEIFGLMEKVGLSAPPERSQDDALERWRHRMADQMAALLERDADRLRIPVRSLLHVLRLLTFAGSHPEIADHRVLTPEEIVDVILYGALHRAGEDD